jgi:hypothetical protein
MAKKKKTQKIENKKWGKKGRGGRWVSGNPL